MLKDSEKLITVTLVLVGFPHLIMVKMLVSSVSPQGRNGVFQCQQLKSFPDNFLELYVPGIVEKEGGRKEKRKEGQKRRKHLFNFSLHVSVPLEVLFPSVSQLADIPSSKVHILEAIPTCQLLAPTLKQVLLILFAWNL